MTGAALLETRGLTVSFGGLQALRDLNFEVYPGEIVAVIGPNGAGKTTLFNAITATVPVTSGDILLEGRSLRGVDPSHVTARGIARTFQNVRLFANMTVLENVMVAQHCRTHCGVFGALFCTRAFRREEAEIRERAEQILGVLRQPVDRVSSRPACVHVELCQPSPLGDRPRNGHSAEADPAR